MNYVKRLASVLAAVTISALSFTSAVSAQGMEKYLNLGEDSSGDPFLLDTTTMGKIERGFGSVLLIYQIKNGLMNEMLVKASCGDNRLWIVGFRTYGQSGSKLAEDRQQQEVQIQGASPASKSMRYYCHSIGARGW